MKHYFIILLAVIGLAACSSDETPVANDKPFAEVATGGDTTTSAEQLTTSLTSKVLSVAEYRMYSPDDPQQGWNYTLDGIVIGFDIVLNADQSGIYREAASCAFPDGAPAFYPITWSYDEASQLLTLNVKQKGDMVCAVSGGSYPQLVLEGSHYALRETPSYSNIIVRYLCSFEQMNRADFMAEYNAANRQ